MKQLETLPNTPSAEVLANYADLEFIKVCHKEVTREDCTKFPAFFGYRKLFNAEACTFVDVMSPITDDKGQPQMVTKSFRLILDDVIKASLLKDNHFPYILAVSKKENDYFVTWDKNPNTKEFKLDKNGKKHKIVGIRGYRELLTGLTSMSLDDLDDEE